MMAKLTESDKQRLEKAKKLYAIVAPHRMDHQNECPSDVQLVLMINRWINPWHACQDLEKIIPFKERLKIKEKIQ